MSENENKSPKDEAEANADLDETVEAPIEPKPDAAETATDASKGDEDETADSATVTPDEDVADASLKSDVEAGEDDESSEADVAAAVAAAAVAKQSADNTSATVSPSADESYEDLVHDSADPVALREDATIDEADLTDDELRARGLERDWAPNTALIVVVLLLGVAIIAVSATMTQIYRYVAQEEYRERFERVVDSELLEIRERNVAMLVESSRVEEESDVYRIPVDRATQLLIENPEWIARHALATPEAIEELRQDATRDSAPETPAAVEDAGEEATVAQPDAELDDELERGPEDSDEVDSNED